MKCIPKKCINYSDQRYKFYKFAYDNDHRDQNNVKTEPKDNRY